MLLKDMQRRLGTRCCSTGSRQEAHGSGGTREVWSFGKLFQLDCKSANLALGASNICCMHQLFKL